MAQTENRAMNRLLVATDGSEGATRAVRFAAGMAANYGAELLIINVVGGYGLPGTILREFSEAQNAWFDELLATNSRRILQDARNSALEVEAKIVALDSRRGEVVRVILDIARERDCDAIIVGKRGEGQVEAVLLGSVSQKLVSLADRVVMVVP